VPFSAYATSPAAQLAPCMANARPPVLITESSPLGTAHELGALSPSIEHVVVLDGDGARGMNLDGLQGLCPDAFDAHESASQVGPEDLCSLVYTSGTTGAPKGVPYLHRCLMATTAPIHGHTPVSPGGRAISYRPIAHIAERVFGHYAAFAFGCELTSLGDAARLGQALPTVRPTRFFGVPRLWEKLLAGVHRALGEQFAPEQTAALHAAWQRSIARVDAAQAGESPASELETTREQDDSALAPLSAMLGLDAAEWLGVAGAPAGRDTLLALHALGLEVNELYGLSETIIVSESPPERVKIGAVGLPLPGVKVRLAGDGEILVGGVTVMPGYLDEPDRTAEVLVDGWMPSGDIGAFDEGAYLRITDRKEALIINSAGKDMSPAAIEQAIRGGHPLIGQVVATGDRRPYNVALIVLDPGGLEALRATKGIEPAPRPRLAADPEVLAAVEQAVQEGNAKLSRVEQVKRCAVLDRVWQPAGAEPTPTGKLKRGPITDQIDELHR
jgi:long-subunit acyl-CoA synthetase (AMP-forming)